VSGEVMEVIQSKFLEAQLEARVSESTLGCIKEAVTSAAADVAENATADVTADAEIDAEPETQQNAHVEETNAAGPGFAAIEGDGGLKKQLDDHVSGEVMEVIQSKFLEAQLEARVSESTLGCIKEAVTSACTSQGEEAEAVAPVDTQGEELKPGERLRAAAEAIVRQETEAEAGNQEERAIVPVAPTDNAHKDSEPTDEPKRLSVTERLAALRAESKTAGEEASDRIEAHRAQLAAKTAEAAKTEGVADRQPTESRRPSVSERLAALRGARESKPKAEWVQEPRANILAQSKVGQHFASLVAQGMMEMEGKDPDSHTQTA